MLKKIIVSAFVFGALAFSNAQKIDALSNKILNQITEQHHQNKNTYFEFVFGSGTNGKISRKEVGNFYSEGEKYILNVMDTKQIFDGKKIYNINEEDQEVTIAQPNENDAVFSPISYLKNYRKDFNVTHIGKKKVMNRNTDWIKLTPIKSSGLDFVYLFVDTQKNELVKLEQHAKNKDIAIIVITKYFANQKGKKSFKFNKKDYKEYIITEL